jgi:hypothetical protein
MGLGGGDGRVGRRRPLGIHYVLASPSARDSGNDRFYYLLQVHYAATNTRANSCACYALKALHFQPMVSLPALTSKT